MAERGSHLVRAVVDYNLIAASVLIRRALCKDQDYIYTGFQWDNEGFRIKRAYGSAAGDWY